MDACKIDHALPGTVPADFCRGCHPELVATPEERRQRVAKEKANAKKEAHKARELREIARLERELLSTSMRKAKPDSIKGRIKKSHQKKLEKLRQKRR